MTTKTKRNKAKTRREAKANSAQSVIKLAVSNPNDTLLDKLTQADAQGADSFIDMTEDGKICILVKNPITGLWENDWDRLKALQSLYMD